MNRTHVEKYCKLGSTDIKVTPLCYGCAAAYARDLISDEFAIDLFKTAYDMGIHFFDTGHSYGKAEQRIGMALKAHSEIKRENIVLSTKFGTRIVDGKYVHDVSLDWVKRSIELSLKRMATDYLDICYVHGPTISDMNDGLYHLLEDYKGQKIIRATGANSFDLDVINYIQQTKFFDVVMLDYNITMQEREPQIKSLYEKGIGVVAGQAIAEGVFLNDLYKIRSKKDVWYLARTMGRKASRDLFFKSRKYRFLNHIKGYSGSQIALKYVIDNPYVSAASFGTCSMEHLRQNVNAVDLKIPPKLKNRIQSV